MDPEEFKKKYGFSPFPVKKAVQATVPTAAPVIPVDPRTMFPGQSTSTPTSAPSAPVATGPRVSPFVSGTDPVAQETQAAFYQKFGFPMYPPNFFPSDPSAQPESPGRQVPGGRALVTEPTGVPVPEVRPADRPDLPAPRESRKGPPGWPTVAVPDLFSEFGSIPSGLMQGLTQGLKSLDMFDTGTVVGAGAQQAWSSPMATAAAGMTPGGEERYEQTREAAIEATPVGRWLDGRYGDVTSGESFDSMVGDLTQLVEEQPIGYSIAFGVASPTNLIPVPILDSLVGVLFRGAWNGVKLVPKTKRTLSWLINGEWPTANVDPEDVVRLSQTVADAARPPTNPDLPFFHWVDLSPDGKITGIHTVTDTPKTRAIYDDNLAKGHGRYAGENERIADVLEKGGYARKVRDAVSNEQAGRVSDDAITDDIPVALVEPVAGPEAPRVSEADRFLRPGELHPNMDPAGPTGSRVQQYVRGDDWHDSFAPMIPDSPAHYSRFFPQEKWVPGHTNHPYLMHFIDDFLVDIGDPNLNVDIDNPWVLDKLRTYADRWENWPTSPGYRQDLPANYYALEKNVAESLRQAVDGPVEQRRTWLEDVRDRIHKYSLEKNAEMREQYSPHWKKGAPGTTEWVAKWQTRLDEVKSSFDGASDDRKLLGPAVTRAKNFANKLSEETGVGAVSDIPGLEALKNAVDEFIYRPSPKKITIPANMDRWRAVRDRVNEVKLPDPMATDVIDEGGVLVGSYTRFFQPPMVEPIVISREAAIAAGREIHETSGSLPSQLGDTPPLWAEAAPVPEPVAAAPTPVAEVAPAPAAAPAPRVRIAEEAPAPGTIGLPKALLDSKPGYRDIREVNFDDPLDKAFYIVAGRDYLSKGDPVFLRWLMDETGLDREQVLREAATIREEMKGFYVEGSDEMNIPQLFNETRAGELPTEEAFGPVLGQSRVSDRNNKFKAGAAAARKTGGGDGFKTKLSLIRKEAHERLYEIEDTLDRPLTRSELDELEESVV